MPTAWDGQSLASQPPDVQALFRRHYGAGAEARWVQEHNQELLQQGRYTSDGRPVAVREPQRDPMLGNLYRPELGPGDTVPTPEPRAPATTTATPNGDAVESWIQDYHRQLMQMEADRLAMQQAYQDSQLSLQQGQQQLNALQILSQPGTNYFAQFARAPRDARIPLTPEIAALAQGRRIPGYGTVGDGDIPTVPNDPAIIHGVYEDAVRNLTNESVRNISHGGQQRLGVLGTVGGIDPAAVWRERQRALPTQSRLAHHVGFVR